VIDNLGVTVTHTVSPSVNPSLTVTANASSIPTVGTAVSFTTSITGGVSPVSCSWTFGDSSSGTGCFTSHSYTSAGAFVSTVIAIDSLNVTSTYSVTLVVDLGLALSIDPSPAEIGVPVTFTTAATGGLSPYAYNWSFGDGTSQTGSIVTHTFTSPKLYSVKLTASDSNGNMGSLVKQIQVQPALTVTLSSDSAGGVAPTAVRFNATASWGVGPFTFAWNFGDGQKATGPSVAHNYTTPNSYMVQVTVTDSVGIIASGRLAITVTAQPTPSTPPTNISTTGPIPVDLLSYGIGGLFAILVIVAPIYVIMVRRRQSRSEKQSPTGR
jgi:PKD repeat protein